MRRRGLALCPVSLHQDFQFNKSFEIHTFLIEVWWKVERLLFSWPQGFLPPRWFVPHWQCQDFAPHCARSTSSTKSSEWKSRSEEMEDGRKKDETTQNMIWTQSFLRNLVFQKAMDCKRFTIKESDTNWNEKTVRKRCVNGEGENICDAKGVLANLKQFLHAPKGDRESRERTAGTLSSKLTKRGKLHKKLSKCGSHRSLDTV